ncbi:MAG: spore coat protein CotJB [Clostridia bacterium]|nr:spore coat protein CotJB [Clostridia bacterium]
MTSPNKTRNEMMRALQEADFAVYDLLLYLDTHPDDEKALAMYQDLVRRAQDAKRAYEQAYGPVTADAARGTREWTWIKSPWPWD